MNEGLKGLERHENEGKFWQNDHFGVNYPLTI